MLSRQTILEQPAAMLCACPCACRCAQKNRSGQLPGLFEDEEFPACWNVLYKPSVAAAWMRPHEICQEPHLFSTKLNQSKIDLNSSQNNWFTAICSVLCERPQLLNKVVPGGQVLYGPGYDGSIIFRMWHLGEWRDIKIDDRLPVDGKGVPIYTRCTDANEFWLPLLEKAFAKFHNTYRYIYDANESYFMDGLVKLTGYSLNTMGVSNLNPENTFNHLQNQTNERSLVLCQPQQGLSGTLQGPYMVTEVCNKAAEGNPETSKVIRLRSPWGQKTDMRFGNEQLQKRSEEIKLAMGYSQEGGDCWMDLKDFCHTFSQISFGMEKPLYAQDMKMVTKISGQWKDKIDAGGHPHDIEKFAENPQFLLIALREEREESDINNVKSTSAGIDTIIELVQEQSIQKRSWDYKISFYIFETYTECRMTAQQLLQMNYIAGDTDCEKVSSVHCRLRLIPGRRYIIIPTTCTPGYAGAFLLRVFSHQTRLRLTELPH